MDIGDTVKIGRETYEVVGGIVSADVAMSIRVIRFDRPLVCDQKTVQGWAAKQGAELLGYGCENNQGFVRLRRLT